MISEFLYVSVIVYPAETAFLSWHICPMVKQNKQNCKSSFLCIMYFFYVMHSEDKVNVNLSLTQ